MTAGETLTVANAAVEIRGITKRFGDVVAVDNIDLSIADGEFFALLGPSGCGKTTTLRMIAGLEFPTQGCLKIFGKEVGTLPPNKRPVNTVFQNYALFPHLNALDNVAFGLKMQGVSRSTARLRALKTLDLVQLSGMDTRRPSELSGGQQQRVALARALVNQPKVLLLDEPLGALDLKLRQEMQGELKNLQQNLGVSFVFVTHDQEEALTMSDRIAVMNDGKLLQVGTPEEIYEHPTNRFVADFIGQANLLEGRVVDAQTVCLSNGTRIKGASDHPVGTSAAVSVRPERVRLAPRNEHPAGPATNRRAEQSMDQTRVDGVVESVTYLGNARVYRVRFDWMTIEVREENRPDATLHEPGTEVVVSWDASAVSVVAD